MLTLYIADVERDAGMKKLSREEAAKVLEGMKVKIEIPKAAVTQWERNAALDMAIEVLNCSEIPNKSDTISRQAALDALRKCQTYLFDERDPDKKIELRSAERAIEDLPSAQPEQRWIPCSERLPKVGERVLAQQVNGTMQVMKCIDGGHLKWFYSRTVAWMPLPKPYHEEVTK